MKPIRTTSFDARECAIALRQATTAVVDLETTGKLRHDQIVAVGVLCHRDAFILITNEHRELSSLGLRVSNDQLRAALAPLEQRRDLKVIMHYASFDLGMLYRAGLTVNTPVLDTLKLMKLVDSDRGSKFDAGETGGNQRPRLHRRSGDSLNYRLKDIARTELNINPLDFPGNVSTLPVVDLATYLKSDLVTTSKLHQRICEVASPRCLSYDERLIQPIAPLLVQMTNEGVAVDTQFVAHESQRLVDLMQQLSCEHQQRFGIALDIGDWNLRRWIYLKGLGCQRVYSGKRYQLSLRSQDLLTLRKESMRPSVKESLGLIVDYQQARSIMTRLRSLTKDVCPHSHRIHSIFNDTQSSGRISSTHPNLQQIASPLGPGGRKQLVSTLCKSVSVHSRNAIVASEGHTLVACDIAQADIRVLGHMVESFNQSGMQHIRSLHAERNQIVGPANAAYLAGSKKFIQPWNRKAYRCSKCWTRVTSPSIELPSIVCTKCGHDIPIPPSIPPFDPTQPCRLAEDFRNSGKDFYTTAAMRMLGREPRDKTERNQMKQTILGVVNGMSAQALAKRLDVNLDIAKQSLEAFARAYPQVEMFKALTKHAYAITGKSWTFADHHRRVTPHHWMVTEPEVELLVSYRGADKLWLRVVPLRPNRHTLRCWVLSAIDGKYGSKNEGKEIYHHEDGRISQLPYRFFKEADLIYKLPVRNISWRLIRRVRTKSEEAVYDGYDKTWRQLFNHTCQGGTADIAKQMMIRSHSVCDQFSAHLLLQIHDELVFEVPDEHLQEFTNKIIHILTLPPSENFRIPIVVEPKIGKRFGELKEFAPCGS